MRIQPQPAPTPPPLPAPRRFRTLAGNQSLEARKKAVQDFQTDPPVGCFERGVGNSCMLQTAEGALRVSACARHPPVPRGGAAWQRDRHPARGAAPPPLRPLLTPPSPQSCRPRPSPAQTTVFLLSLQQGAVGLTLSAASHVFLLEPQLKLAQELQARLLLDFVWFVVWFVVWYGFVVLFGVFVRRPACGNFDWCGAGRRSEIGRAHV